ncbi:uncharacterized protein GIQ15_06842 [Arthroderma uncinatum]|uniref:uncharacterized protein n=1 Tax=Arthroderma uncinatum TaxID=74035 RepID=UPI00144A8AF4|nr:uncharacterized protein GIQ15_06842 [Arthroderma uncinatum]KAF3479866.1 hypothetical protein GIQ15_06842 [Arthroderma uncinatum]
MDEKKPAVPDEPVAGKKSGKENRRNSKAPATNTDTSHMLSQPDATAPKPKRVRKRKDDDDKAKTKKEKNSTGDKAAGGKDGESKPRRQRNSNVKAAESSDATVTAASRKKAKLEHKADESTTTTASTPSATPRQAKITDMVPMNSTPTAHPQQQQLQQHQFSQHAPQTSSAQQPSPQAFPSQSVSQLSPPPSTLLPASYPSRNGSYEAGAPITSPYTYQPPNSNSNSNSHHGPPPQVAPPQARPASLPRSSGQNYDPIRSAIESSSSVSTPAMTAMKPAPAHTSFSPPPNTVTPPPRPTAATPFRASASPAISSIIDPPVVHSTPTVVIPHPVAATSDNKPTPSPTHLSANGATDSSKPTAHPLTQSRSQDSNAMDVDSKPTSSKPGPKKATASSAGNPSSGTQSPKPTAARNKEPPRPLPSTGSGLLSNALFGVDTSSSSDTKSLPNIILHIPLKGQSNLVINFARLAEEQYGFDALHPRIAAQKERRARLAAASAVLEKSERAGRGESGAEDDLSLDADRDSDGDGDINMSGMGTNTPTMNGTATDETAAAGAPPAAPNVNADGKKTRRRKIEEYDRDDPFVDDSELIWEEQAAACKDGFFVYSGLLVQEGDKVSVEKADGTTKRGRGRRGGASGTTHGNSGTSSRGRGGHAGSSATTHHPNGDGATAGKSGTGRGGARKPRITKADRLQMEKEKVEREKLAIGLSGKTAAK